MIRKGSLMYDLSRLPKRIGNGKLYRGIRRVKSPVLRWALRTAVLPAGITTFGIEFIVQLVWHIAQKTRCIKSEHLALVFAYVCQIIVPFGVTTLVLTVVFKLFELFTGVLKHLIDFSLSSQRAFIGVSVLIGLAMVVVLMMAEKDE